jgi:hypothetical protein
MFGHRGFLGVLQRMKGIVVVIHGLYDSLFGHTDEKTFDAVILWSLIYNARG